MLSCVSESAAWATCNTASTLPKNTIFTHTKYLTSLTIYLTKCSYWGEKSNLNQVTLFLVSFHTFVQPAGWREDGHGVAVL